MVDDVTPASEVANDQVTNSVTQTEAPQTPKAELPKEVKDALKKANKEAETLRLRLKEYEDRDKTELQKLQEERDSLLAEKTALSLEQMRREVADEKGLTPAQARRLVGSTREELEPMLTKFSLRSLSLLQSHHLAMLVRVSVARVHSVSIHKPNSTISPSTRRTRKTSCWLWQRGELSLSKPKVLERNC